VHWTYSFIGKLAVIPTSQSWNKNWIRNFELFIISQTVYVYALHTHVHVHIISSPYKRHACVLERPHSPCFWQWWVLAQTGTFWYQMKETWLHLLFYIS
jgi:hypothetical protein